MADRDRTCGRWPKNTVTQKPSFIRFGLKKAHTAVVIFWRQRRQKDLGGLKGLKSPETIFLGGWILSNLLPNFTNQAGIYVPIIPSLFSVSSVGMAFER